MRLVELPVSAIRAPSWNANTMTDFERSRLRRSIQRFGIVVPLVVRAMGDGQFETIGGAQRLSVIAAMGIATVACVVVETDDAESRLLAQALNGIHGEDDPGLRVDLLRDILQRIPADQVAALLPETGQSLSALASLGEQDLAEALRIWEAARSTGLRSLQIRLTEQQLASVERTLAGFFHQVAESGSDSPNRRGIALYLLCEEYRRLAGRTPA